MKSILIVVSLSFLTWVSNGQTKNNQQEMNHQLITDYYKNLDKHKGDLSKNSAVHTDMTFQFAGNPGIMDVNTFNAPSKAYYEAFPDLKHTVKDVVVSGNQIACKVVADRDASGRISGS